VRRHTDTAIATYPARYGRFVVIRGHIPAHPPDGSSTRAQRRLDGLVADLVAREARRQAKGHRPPTSKE